jgi:hypothetical protein
MARPPFTHPCAICGERVPLDSLVAHLDDCRSSAVAAAAASWGIPADVARLFMPGTHDFGKGGGHVAAILAPAAAPGAGAAAGAGAGPSESHAAPPGWYEAAAAHQFGVAPVVPCPPLAAADTPTHHAIILLPAGPSYVVGPHDAHAVFRLPPRRRGGADGGAGAGAGAGVVLLVGSEAAARSAKFLRRNRVVAIVNCAVDSVPLAESARAAAGVRGYWHLRLVDAAGDRNRALLEEGADAVAAAAEAAYAQAEEEEDEAAEAAEAGTQAAGSSAGSRNDGGGGSGGSGGGGARPPPAILVHCVAGVSRSVSVAAAYLIRHAGLTVRDAVGAVKSARKVAYPNLSFWHALRAIEAGAAPAGAPPSISDAALGLHKSSPLTALRIRE